MFQNLDKFNILVSMASNMSKADYLTLAKLLSN